MSDRVLWVFALISAYSAVCIFLGVRSGRSRDAAREFFAPAGGIPTWVFVIFATGASFAGWTVTGQPSLVFHDGFQYVNASFFVITIPLAGMLVLKRQWVLGRKFGYVTPGQMYSEYYGGDAIATISVGVAVLFAIPFLAMLFGASGWLLQELTDRAVSREVAMWGLASVVLIYAVTGGLRAVAHVGVIQGLAFVGTIAIVGILALDWAGGFSALNQGLAKIAAAPIGEAGTTHGFGGGDYSGLFAIPGVIQWTRGLGMEDPAGGPWTAVMGLSFALSLTGIQLAPGFSVWGFASKGPRAFAIHHIWGSAFCIGIVMFLFMPLAGMAAHLLGADGAASTANLAVAGILPVLVGGQHRELLLSYIRAIGSQEIWLGGLLAVAAIAALQSTAAAFMSAAGNILSRDVYKRHINAAASWNQQRVMACVAMLLLCLAALLMASFAMKAVVILAGLAIPCSFQLLPSLLGSLWFPWLSRRAATFGLIVGLVIVVLTEPLGQVLTGNTLPWGRWPWTIHSGLWGMVANLAICLAATAFMRGDADRGRREAFHQVLNDAIRPAAKSMRMKSAAWILVLLWIFFAAGPGAVIGNAIFGDPGGGYAAWTFGAPSIWVWQVFWWALGVGLIWFLGEKMELSTVAGREMPAPMMANVAQAGGLSDGR
jgi:SSS family solute:Na+ symporter